MPPKELVLLGGGHSHVEVLRSFGQLRRQRYGKPSVPPTAAPANHTAPAPPRPALTDNEGHPQHTPPSTATDTPGGVLHSPASRLGSGDSPAVGPAAEAVDYGDGVRLTVVSRGRFTPYSGMLPGWASGHYSFLQCHIDLLRLARYAGASLLTAEATGLDTHARWVHFADRPPLPYDVLSVDVGIAPAAAGVPGASQHATPVKPIDSFARRYEHLVQRYRDAAAAAAAAAAATSAAAGPGGSPMRVCVVGGGAGGVELAAAVRHRLEEERRRGGWQGVPGAGAAVSLLSRGPLLEGHPPSVRHVVARALAARGVAVREGAAVVGVCPGELELSGGGVHPYDECLWCTQAAPPAWLRDSGLPTDANGFVLINEMLQSDGGPPEVFAAGDVASCLAHPRPKAGVFAVRQGPPLANNLRAYLEGRPLQPFVSQDTALALISLGDKAAVASRTGSSSSSSSSGGHAGGGGGTGAEWGVGWLLNGCGGVAGAVAAPLLWRWKDSIDRAFMRRYGEDLGPDPGLPPPSLPA